MNVQSLLQEAGRIDEPRAVEGYSEVLTRVASEGRPVILRRNGADLAAVIPLQYLELLQELLARDEVERLAAQMNWDHGRPASPPPQAWFDDERDNPFEPEEGPAS
jgi:PHD/YefM family antitoxin component YafN of YafNO toxin-antitoxin module